MKYPEMKRSLPPGGLGAGKAAVAVVGGAAPTAISKETAFIECLKGPKNLAQYKQCGSAQSKKLDCIPV